MRFNTTWVAFGHLSCKDLAIYCDQLPFRNAQGNRIGGIADAPLANEQNRKPIKSNYCEIVIWDVLVRLRMLPELGQNGMFSGSV